MKKPPGGPVVAAGRSLLSPRVLVIGGNGLVGNALVRGWSRRGIPVIGATYHCHAQTAFRQLDMQDAVAVARLLDELTPTLVALPAAQPHVDYIELHPEETRRINVDGTRTVASACRDHDIPLIFFSSDYVFDGRKGTYNEEDPPTPVNEYGRQKAEAERLVLDLGPHNLVMRTSGVYGWQSDPKNFVLQLKNRLSRGERMRVARDLRYNPTNADNLADVTIELAMRGASGIFHAVGDDRLSRHVFALKAAAAFGLDGGLIEPVFLSSLDSPTPRPLESSLDTRKIRRLFAAQLWGADRGLRAMRDSEADWLGWQNASAA